MIRVATLGMTLVMIRTSIRARIQVATHALLIRVFPTRAYPTRAVRLRKVLLRSLPIRAPIVHRSPIQVTNLSAASLLQR